MSSKNRVTILLALWFLAASGWGPGMWPDKAALAENWPGWRGPRGDGSSSDVLAPRIWDASKGKNIRWKQPLPGVGHSSPIVWQDRVYLTACDTETHQRLLICLDRATGTELWQKTVLTAPLEAKHSLNSYASSTPVTDGELVYVAFLEVGTEQIPAPNVGNHRLIYPGVMVIAAFDLDGRARWMVRPGPFISAHGFCSNPILYQDKLIINGDHDGDSYIVALDKKSGEEIWRAKRRYKTRSYVTPLIRKVAGEEQMVLSGSKCVVSMDPNNGQMRWSVDGPTEQFVASMVFDGTRFFAVGGYPTHHVIAIRPDGVGDVTASHVAWHQTNARSYVPSPVVVDHYLIVADDRGTANCFDTQSGTRYWQARMGKQYRSSLVSINGLVHLTATDGKTVVLKPGPKPEVVAENSLGESVFASPAVSGGDLFIRGSDHLFCISEMERMAAGK